MKIKNKRAQVGETMTWVIATIVIIVILIISIFITNFVLGGGKNFNIFRSRDIIATKSLSAYLLTLDDSGKRVFNQLKDEENLNDFNGNLSLKIFKNFYKKDYPFAVWFGVDFEGFGIRKNDYFGSRSISQKSFSFILERVELKKDKWATLILMARENE